MARLTENLVKKQLQVGQILTFKELCEKLKQPYYGGNQKIGLLNKMNCFFKYEKVDRKIKILEIYDKRIKNNSEKPPQHNYKYNEEFLPDVINGRKHGVYIIKQENNVYIGSTMTSFKRRFSQHYGREHQIRATYEMLHNGGTFDILWIAEEKDSEKKVRAKEADYIKLYIDATDYNVINQHMETHVYSSNNKKKKEIKQSKEPKENKVKEQKKEKVEYQVLRINKQKINMVKQFLQDNDIEFKV